MIAEESNLRGLTRSGSIRNWLILFCTLSLCLTIPHASAVPSASVVGFSKITVTNNASIDTSSPFQERVTLTSQSLGAFAATNLQNVEFATSDGTPLPSWLESANPAATSATFWIKLPGSVPAKSSVTIFAEFVAQTTNLFDGTHVGEAPRLSPTYAQYDNGGTMFDFYDNFAGSILNPHWNMVASNGIVGDRSQVFVNNNLTIVPTLGAFYWQGTWVGATGTSSSQARGPVTADAAIAAAQPVTNFARSACQLGCFEARFGFEDNFPSNLAEGNGLGFDIAQPSVLTISNNQYNQVFVPLPTTTLNQFNIYTVNYATTNASFELNYSDLAGSITSDVPPPSQSMGLFLETNYQQISGDIGWVRTRASPPSGVMPVATAGQAQSGSPNYSSPLPLTFAQLWFWIALGIVIVTVAVFMVIRRTGQNTKGKANQAPSKTGIQVCSSCGGAMPAGSPFCGHCGTRFVGSDS